MTNCKFKINFRKRYLKNKFQKEKKQKAKKRKKNLQNNKIKIFKILWPNISMQVSPKIWT